MLKRILQEIVDVQR